MTTKGKKFVKKVWKPIFITVLVFVTVSFAATKLVYDGIFARYDPEIPGEVAEDLSALRKEVDFPSSEIQLQGYFYPGKDKKVLLVLAPGFRAGGDDYLAQIRSFLDFGWGVFAFDPTGSCESGGDSCVGFSQEVYDLQAALEYLQGQERYGYENLVLFGHSRGGYAVCCQLQGDFDLAAVISVAGSNSAMESVMEPAVDAVGPLAYGNYPFLWAYQALLFGRDTVNLDVAEILSETTTPTLIVHGRQDQAVSYEDYSIISYREEIQSPCVEFFTVENAGHTDILFDADGSAKDSLMKEIQRFVLDSIGN